MCNENEFIQMCSRTPYIWMPGNLITNNPDGLGGPPSGKHFVTVVVLQLFTALNFVPPFVKYI